jgi:hypothetical protein
MTWDVNRNYYGPIKRTRWEWCSQPANTKPQITLLWLNKPVFLNAQESGIGEKTWTTFLGYQGYGAWLGKIVLSEPNLLTPAFDNNGNRWSDVNVQINKWRWNYYNGQISMAIYRLPSSASSYDWTFIITASMITKARWKWTTTCWEWERLWLALKNNGKR